jgi:hypothetical protein
VVDGEVERLGASSSEQDLSAVAALLGHWSDAGQAAQGASVSEANGVVGMAEERSEDECADAGQRGKDRGVGKGLVGAAVLFEPLFEKLVGVTSEANDDEELFGEYDDMLGGCVEATGRDAKRWRLQRCHDVIEGDSSDFVLSDESANRVHIVVALEHEYEQFNEEGIDSSVFGCELEQMRPASDDELPKLGAESDV